MNWIDEVLALTEAAGPHICWNDPVEPGALLAFEQAHGIELPADYKDVLIQLGNGCSGFVTLFPLGTVIWNDEAQPVDEWFDEPALALARPFPYHADAGEGAEAVNDDFDEDDDEDEAEVDYEASWRVDGALPVADNHCACIVNLVTTGDERGFMWEQEIGDMVPVPAATPLLRSVGFAEWIAIELAKHLGRADLLASWRRN